MDKQILATQADRLRHLVLSMGGRVEAALTTALQGLAQADAKQLLDVHSIEDRINAEHMEVDEECLKYLAQKGPVARDLRRVISYLKVNTDLERMGDQCVNIAHNARDFIQRGQMSVADEILVMGPKARRMVSLALDAFVREDAALANEVLALDDELDALKQSVFHLMTEKMRENPKQIEAALDLVLIARNLERMGDHATNVAENVIFVSTGEDIRHGGKHYN